MKVYIGPYRRHLSAYRLIEHVPFLSEKARDKLTDAIQPVLNVMFNNWWSKRRCTVVKVDNYDVWSADHTLATVIVPVLERLQKVKHGIPNTMFSDRYNELHAMKEFWSEPEQGPLHAEADIEFEKAVQKWDDTINEMIWAFTQIRDDKWEEQFFPKDGSWDKTGHDAHFKRIQEGINLFAKHYFSLWD